jgi:hypothetical protein
MPIAYNEKTGSVVIYINRKFISREAAEKMFGCTPGKYIKRKTKKVAKKE